MTTYGYMDARKYKFALGFMLQPLKSRLNFRRRETWKIVTMNKSQMNYMNVSSIQHDGLKKNPKVEKSFSHRFISKLFAAGLMLRLCLLISFILTISEFKADLK